MSFINTLRESAGMIITFMYFIILIGLTNIGYGRVALFLLIFTTGIIVYYNRQLLKVAYNYGLGKGKEIRQTQEVRKDFKEMMKK